MSRCFPFPPPGYEKKARTEGVDLLRKEKHKEKKHKKEKRDREKKEGKEKKEKDRNDEKHREKKDRKEKDKHREKKKSKEKDTSKETKGLPGETNGEQHNQSRLAGQVEGYKGEKINQKQDSVKLKRSTFEVKSAGEFEGYHKDKLSQINIARQVEANKGGILSQKQDSSKQKSSTAEVKPAGQFEGCNGERLSHNNLSFEAEKVPKFIQEVGPRVHDNNKRKGVQVVENLSGLDCKNGGTVKLVASDNNISLQGVNRTAEKRFGDRHLNEQASGARFKTLEVQNLPGTVQNKLEELPNKFESIDTQKTVRKEKIKEKGSDVKKGEKHKKDQEKKSHGKSKDRNKEKSQGKNKNKSKERKKDEKVELIVNQKDIDNHEMIDSSKTHFSCGQDIHLFHLPEVADSSGAEGNIRKRKELEANGFLHDNDVRPNKLQKTSFHPCIENGVRLEHCRTSTLPSSSREEPNNSLKLGNSGKRLNGIVEPQQYSVRLTKPSLDTAQAGEVAQVSHKRPHPSVDTAQADEVAPVSHKRPHPSLDTAQADEVAQVSHKRPHPSLDTAKADEIAQVSHKRPHPSLDTAQADEVAQVSHKRPHPSLDTAQADEVAQVSHKRPHPSLNTAQADEVAQVSHKRPHRDSKYLSEVLTVPKLEELCDFDDQEWLFSSTVSESKKSRLGSPAGIETQLVWAEAVQIDSADVCALPYVIPY